MMKKLGLIFLVLVCFLLTSQISLAKEEKIYLNLFKSQGCPHCGAEEEFLQSLEQKYPLVINQYDIAKDETIEIIEKLEEKFSKKFNYVPILFIGEDYIEGYLNEETTGKKIEEKIKQKLAAGSCKNIIDECGAGQQQQIDTLNIPILGEIDLNSLSLPALTVVLGIVDGFNPCAMWALVALLAILINTHSKKRILVFGGVFIFISALVYFLFITAFLEIFKLIGFINITKIIIGIASLVVAGFYIRDYLVNRTAECKVGDLETKSKFVNRARMVIEKHSWISGLIAITILAFTVNLVELLCTMGLPAIYTRILTLNHLPSYQYYFYIGLYVFFYMLDDLIIFILAARTLKVVGLQTKYGRYARLVGGILLALLGAYLLINK